MSTVSLKRIKRVTESQSAAKITPEMRDEADANILQAVADMIKAEKNPIKNFVLRKQAYRLLTAYNIEEFKGIGKAGETLKVEAMPEVKAETAPVEAAN